MKETINLVSFPRSGNTFTRYLLESLTGYPSAGTGTLGWEDGDRYSIVHQKQGQWSKDKIHNYFEALNNQPGIILKWHNYTDLLSANTIWQDSWHADWTSNKCDNKTILLVRHPVEAEASRNKRKHEIGLPEYYFTNILHFLNCQENDDSNKHIFLLYRDVFKYPGRSLNKMQQFVSSPCLNIDQFMLDIDDHRKQSFLKYRNQLKQVPITRGIKSITPYADKMKPWLFAENWNRLLDRANTIDSRVASFLINEYGQDGLKK